MKLAIIAGAGFSVPMGLPLQGQILGLISAELSREQEVEGQAGGTDGEEIAAWRRDLLSFVQECFGVSGDALLGRLARFSLEDLYTAMDMAAQREDWVAETVDPRAARVALDGLMLHVLRQREGACDRRPLVKAVRGLCRRWEGDWCVVSLNWDTLVECALRQCRRGYHLGRMIHGDQIRRRAPVPAVYKLHGSLDWYVCPRCRQVWVDPHERACEACVQLQSRLSPPLRPMVVTPTMLKRIAVPGLDAVWDEALHAVMAAEQVVVVGYSLPVADYAVRYFLIKALAGRDDATVRVCLSATDRPEGNGHATDTVVRYQSLFGWAGETFRFDGAEALLTEWAVP
jgi:hypothetical protein